MKLFAKKPCSFGGKRFAIGDEIPADLVVNPVAMAKLNVITILEDVPVIDPGKIAVVLHSENGDYPLSLTPEGLQNVVDVLTAKGDAAKAIVEQITEEHALILLDATDSRANIKKAAKDRAMALETEEIEGEQ